MTAGIGAHRRVLITGALGFVGKAVVAELCARGVTVTATGRWSRANDAAAAALRRRHREADLAFEWADLSDATAVADLIDSVRPDVVVHLAAVTPPVCYREPDRAREVNVAATAALVKAASSLGPHAPRFVLASSVGVYGPRNPFLDPAPVTPATPARPTDVYGRLKLEAEEVVTGSGLTWVILRIGGVLGSGATSASRDLATFESLMPTDGRVQTVDVRDVARAFAASVTTDATGRVHLVGGDQSHRRRHGEIGRALTAAMGLPGILPGGRPGDPVDENAWFATDWMDTSESHDLLDYQRIPFSQMLADIRADMGWKYYLGFPVAPLGNLFLRRWSAYHGEPGRHADPWGRIEALYPPTS